MRALLERIIAGKDLDQAQSNSLFSTLVDGKLDAIEIAAFLVALRTKGERPPEIAGAAEALRASATRFPSPQYAYADSCGTGGDGLATINVSTAVALVAAEMGIPVAKHGNRSVSSACGSADLLEELGVKIDASPDVSRKCLDEARICFLFAPQYHSGIRHASPVRQSLRIRTIFNLIGPLVNPSSPRFQILGVYRPELCVPLARTLGLLGVESALVVHGSGLDEVAVHGPTTAALYRDGSVTELELSPEKAGSKRYTLDSLTGGTPKENAAFIKRMLKGDGRSAHAASVAINAGALAWIFGTADDLKSGTAMAQETIGSGRCYERLRKFRELSHGA
jgi:anthranilate phosphoribosyltransferase